MTQDEDLKELAKSDQFSIEFARYRLIKSYRLKIDPNATVTGVRAEMKDMKEDGYDVELGITDDEMVIQATKVVELTDLEELAGKL